MPRPGALDDRDELAWLYGRLLRRSPGVGPLVLISYAVCSVVTWARLRYGCIRVPLVSVTQPALLAGEDLFKLGDISQVGGFVSRPVDRVVGHPYFLVAADGVAEALGRCRSGISAATP